MEFTKPGFRLGVARMAVLVMGGAKPPKITEEMVQFVLWRKVVEIHELTA